MFTLVHQSLEKHARMQEEKEAVRMNEHSLSYGELNRKAENLSDILKNSGVNNKECVGIYMDKCLDFVASIFGILKVGAVYVPMDIETPESRTIHIISECDISILLTTPALIGKIERIIEECRRPLKVIIMPGHEFEQDTHISGLECIEFHQKKENSTFQLSSTEISPDQLATILYTSGSSGIPKGVMITHKNIMKFKYWAIEAFNINPYDRLISHAPFHFDLSLFDIFAAIYTGACVVLIPKNRAGNPKYITQLVSKEKITIWQSVPSILVLLAKYGDWKETEFSYLRHVLFAGETMPVEYLKFLIFYFLNAEFHNIYGCTETNDTFMYTIPKENIPDPLPIGRSLPYVDYKIVNESNQLVNKNEEGELLVTAPTMMMGYRSGDKSCFVKIKEGSHDQKGINYYRTRDIVTELPDGNLHFCGRNDNIIKSNGYRINLLEIERCLQSHTHINEIAVIPLPDPEVGNKIIAVVTIEPDSIVKEIDLKLFCVTKLPKYAIPHIFEIRKGQLPKTSSGKVNAKKLLYEKQAEQT